MGVTLAFAAGPRHEAKDQQGFSAAVTRAMTALPSTLAPERIAELSRRGAALSVVETPDLVAFVDLVPAGALELTLWLESRRPRLDAIPAGIPEALQRARANRDQLLPAPGSLGPAQPRLEQLVFEGFWPYQHDSAVLDPAASADALREFQHAWFAASNAAICISGAFDPEVTLPIVRKYFGDLPRNASPPVFNPAPLPDQTNQRSAAAQAELKPFVAMGWAVPSTRQPEHDALALTTAILGEGQDSRLAHKLSRVRASTSFAVELDERRGPSMFTVSLQSADDAGLLAARKIVDEELDSLARLGPTTDEMRRVWRTAQSAFLEGLQRPEERALRLANLELLHGDARLIHAEVGRRLATGKDDIRKAVARFLSPTRRSIVELNAAGRALEVAPRPAPAAPAPAAVAPPAPHAAPTAAPPGKPAHHKKPPQGAPPQEAQEEVSGLMSCPPCPRFLTVAAIFTLAAACGAPPAPPARSAPAPRATASSLPAASAARPLPDAPEIAFQPVAIPVINHATLPNGLNVWHVGSRTIPTVHVRLVVRSGSDRPALARLTALAIERSRNPAPVPGAPKPRRPPRCRQRSMSARPPALQSSPSTCREISWSPPST